MSIFKYADDGQDLCKRMEDPKGVVQPLMDPSQDRTVFVPDQFAKRKWPADVVSAPRPRFGKNPG